MAAIRLFHCPNCGNTDYRERRYVPVQDRKPYYKGEEYPVPVLCGAAMTAPDGTGTFCRAEMDQVLSGIGKDLLPEDFSVDLDGSGPTRFSSLREVRAFERESEARHRDGTGQIYNFRELSQDRNNREVNSFEGSSYQKGKSRRPERRVTGGGLPIQVRTGHGK